MMKKQYERAEVRMVELSAEDVVTVSRPVLDENEMPII